MIWHQIFLFLQKKIAMDLQTRKIHFIQDFLKYANDSLVARFEELLTQERNMAFEKEIKPMSLKEYEQRIERAVEDVNNNRVKSARNLKNEIASWK